MEETSTFAVCMYGLIVACVAEHLIKHKNYYKGTIKERVWLYVTRVAIAVLVFFAMMSTPHVFDDGVCRPGPEPELGDC
ncbi:MAG: hypothetical protein WAW73_20215 [Rhodoferax sp.]